jgi:FkbM family methyltransferase
MKKFIKRIIGKEKVLYKKSFSQDGEDMILNSIFDDLGGRSDGFFIDVGALHPYRFSNTAFFYDRGWNGINIEPTPNAIAIFNEVRIRDINLNYGVSDVEGEMNFYIFDEPALNSFSKDLSEERAATTNYKILDKVRVPVMRLESILDKHLRPGQHIDFMSIDVEGLDLMVLKSNNWSKYVPDFLFVEEMIEIENLGAAEIHNFLKDKGYNFVAKTPRTLLYQHRSTC